MKLLRNRFFIGALCIILGLVIGFIAIPQIQNISQYEFVQAVRVKQNITVGVQIKADMLETVKVPRNLVPEGTITDISSASSRYSIVPINTGDYVTNNKLGDPKVTQDIYSIATSKGMKVISITLPTLASGVSGKIQPGDIITVLAIPKITADRSMGIEPQGQASTSANSTVLYPELRYIEVCSVSSSDGSNANVISNPTGDEKNKLPLTVSLFATEEQAMLLAELEQKAVLHLTFVARGKDTQQYISSDKHILNSEVK